MPTEINENIQKLFTISIIVVVLIIAIVVGSRLITTMKDTELNKNILTIQNESWPNSSVSNNTKFSLTKVDVTSITVSGHSTTAGNDSNTSTYTFHIFTKDTDYVQSEDLLVDPWINMTSNLSTYNLNITYSFKEHITAYNVSVKGSEGIVTFSDYFDIITIAVVISIIVGILMATIYYFTMGRY